MNKDDNVLGAIFCKEGRWSINRDNKLLIISLSIIGIILLCATITLFVSKESEKDKRIATQKHLDEVIVAERNLEAKLKDAEIMNVEMKTNIKSQDEKIATLLKSLDEVKTANADLTAKIQEREVEAQNLKSKLEEERIEKEDLLKRHEKLNEDYLNLKFQLENLLKMKEELEKKVKELAEKESVSLGTVVIKQ